MLCFRINYFTEFLGNVPVVSYKFHYCLGSYTARDGSRRAGYLE